MPAPPHDGTPPPTTTLQEIEMYGDDELLQRYRDEMQASNDQVPT